MPLSSFLDENPRGALSLATGGLPSQMQRYFSNQYNDIYSKYLAEIGRQTNLGMPPNINFSGFLGSYPWLQEFYGASPQQRGFYPQEVAPRTRWLSY